MTQAQPFLALGSQVEIAPGLVVSSVPELCAVLVDASDEQVNEKQLQDEDEKNDFVLACDAFNFSRMSWRLREELDDEFVVRQIIDSLNDLVCAQRGYSPDDFALALEATEERARFPFGLDPLRYAHVLAKKNPIRVLRPEIADPISTQILAIAVQLKKLNGSRSILLPIEQVRVLLRCRKLIAGGAVKRLMKYNAIVEVGPKAHTGKAREFHLVATEGVHFEFVKQPRTEPKPPL